MKIAFQFNQKKTILKKNVTHSKKRSPLLLSPSNPSISKEERSQLFSVQFSRFQNKPGPAHSSMASMQGIFLLRVKKSHPISTSQSFIGFVLFLYFISFNFFKELSVSSKNLQDSVRHFESLLWSLFFSWPFMLSTIKNHCEKARIYLKGIQL